MLTSIMITLVERRIVTIIHGILPCQSRSVIAAPPFGWRAFDVPNHAPPRVRCVLERLANLETLIAAAAYAAPLQTIKTKTLPENPKRPLMPQSHVPSLTLNVVSALWFGIYLRRRVSSFLKLRTVRSWNLAVFSMPYRATTLRACPRHCIGHTQ